MEPIRIMSLPVDDGGCGNYRVRQPLEMVRRFTEHDTYIMQPQTDDMENILKAIKHTQVIVMRPGSEKGMQQMKEYPEFDHIKWVLDIDDNTEIISPYNFHYEEYGVDEYFDKNLNKWLWKDGERGFDLEKNRLRLLQHITGLKEVDMVTVTTQKLADYAKFYNKNVQILPNSVNLDRWWKPNYKKNRKLRVGWSGGISHYEDWYDIKEPLNELMREHQFTLVLAGQEFKGIVDDDNKHLVESHDWVPFKGHSYRMMCMNLDLAIIPLADLPFNHYKSEIKLVEMSAMGVPSVYADVGPYKAATDGLNIGWRYVDPTSFSKSLKTAITQAGLRNKQGKSARKWVEKHYDAKKNAKLWADAYGSLL